MDDVYMLCFCYFVGVDLNMVADNFVPILSLCTMDEGQESSVCIDG